jgi:hypothetical protein
VVGGVPPGVASRSSPNVAVSSKAGWGRDLMESMERTVVRCAEGHVFATSTFPMQQLGSERIGPGRLIRCPRCARLRQAVPVAYEER